MTLPRNRTLIAEDDTSWQQILSEILTDMDLIADVASNLEDAIKIMKSETHRLAIVDLSLAGGDHHNYDGLRILEAVRRLDPGCQTILLTGYATVELAVSVLTEYGAYTFLRKENFHRAQFRDLISRVMASAPPLKNAPLKVIETSTPSVPETSKEAESQCNKVLVVEDDAGWRSILYELLTDADHDVYLCGSFGDALGYLRREKFALAIIDLSLSNEVIWEQSSKGEHLEGYQLLADTKSAGIPTIVVSGIASADEIQRAYKEYSIFAYLEKQAFDRGTFLRLVEEARVSHQVIDELDCLTDREREVFDLLARGMTNKEIAEALVITTNTVKRHLKAIFEKLGIHTRSAAAAKAIANGSGMSVPPST
jgi:RNA polymerase sigma factor (sigma-70 family)